MSLLGWGFPLKSLKNWRSVLRTRFVRDGRPEGDHQGLRMSERLMALRTALRNRMNSHTASTASRLPAKMGTQKPR